MHRLSSMIANSTRCARQPQCHQTHPRSPSLAPAGLLAAGSTQPRSPPRSTRGTPAVCQRCPFGLLRPSPTTNPSACPRAADERGGCPPPTAFHWTRPIPSRAGQPHYAARHASRPTPPEAPPFTPDGPRSPQPTAWPVYIWALHVACRSFQPLPRLHLAAWHHTCRALHPPGKE